MFSVKENSFGNDKESTNNVNVTSRITYLAMNDDSKTLHLGASNSIRKNSEILMGFHQEQKII